MPVIHGRTVYNAGLGLNVTNHYNAGSPPVDPLVAFAAFTEASSESILVLDALKNIYCFNNKYGTISSKQSPRNLNDLTEIFQGQFSGLSNASMCWRDTFENGSPRNFKLTVLNSGLVIECKIRPIIINNTLAGVVSVAAGINEREARPIIQRRW